MFKVCDESNLEQINYFLSLFNQPMLVDLNSNPFTKYILYLEGNNYIGFIQYSIIYDRAELDYIYVDDKFRSSGIGSKLMNEVELLAKQKGINKIKLITTNDNLQALKFYQKRGYRIVRVITDAVVKAREIKPSIPFIGNDGIPLNDELELVKLL